MTTNLSDKELDQVYESGSRRFMNEQDRIGLPRLVEDIKLNKKYQLTRPQNSEWDTERKSHLIESITFNIPVAPIILFVTGDNVYDVIDGNQRLRAIVDFYSNKFELTGMKNYPELNGYNYRSLPSKIRNGLDWRRLSLVIISQQENSQLTDEQAKQLIRKRYEV
ncbi:MAG: DUF262 domain-containing protein [Crocosphaera sp.]|uniref:DUF262 domain-containing protein n=1 Tax=Crocosphaera sp. TaxID=2729996 RepID=UPI0025861EEA|nr:DUF262 domain-containing protein [Crocosphaera sp.]MCH2246563.1 DUF262 domain-containing protein [Crocosphaera sp.]